MCCHRRAASFVVSYKYGKCLKPIFVLAVCPRRFALAGFFIFLFFSFFYFFTKRTK